jgi:transcriptional regulator with XRE-family HTH domain
MQTNQPLRIAFGQRICDLRKQQGISQEAFGDKCGVMRTYMSRIETGATNPCRQAIKVLADAVSLSDSLAGL